MPPRSAVCVPSGETSAACRIRVRTVEYFMHVTPEFPDDIAMVVGTFLRTFLNVLSHRASSSSSIRWIARYYSPYITWTRYHLVNTFKNIRILFRFIYRDFEIRTIVPRCYKCERYYLFSRKLFYLCNITKKLVT